MKRRYKYNPASGKVEEILPKQDIIGLKVILTAPPTTISKSTKGFIAEWSGRPLRSNPKPFGKRY